MTIEVRVPQLPESVADATLVAWRKQPGDAVARDENMVDLETDKVVLEVPAPAAGVIRELKVRNGETVTSGQLLAVIEEGAVFRGPLGHPGEEAPDDLEVALGHRSHHPLAEGARRFVASGFRSCAWPARVTLIDDIPSSSRQARHPRESAVGPHHDGAKP